MKENVLFTPTAVLIVALYRGSPSTYVLIVKLTDEASTRVRSSPVSLGTIPWKNPDIPLS